MAHIIGGGGQVPERKAAGPGRKPGTVTVELPADIALKISVADIARIGATYEPAEVTKSAGPARTAKPAKKGRRPSVAKKTRKARVICPGCDARMKPKDVACRKCGSRRPGGFAATRSAGKALFVPGGGARPFVVKAARATAVSAGTEPRLRVVKSAEDIQREVFMAMHRDEYRPEVREWHWKSAHPGIYGQGGSAS